MAVDLLAATQLNYTFFNHEEDRKFLEEVKVFYSFPTVPVVLRNNIFTGETRVVGGYADLLNYLK